MLSIKTSENLNEVKKLLSIVEEYLWPDWFKSSVKEFRRTSKRP
jgi:hypothetical protein